MSGRRVLVTGAFKDIGYAIADRPALAATHRSVSPDQHPDGSPVNDAGEP